MNICFINAFVVLIIQGKCISKYKMGLLYYEYIFLPYPFLTLRMKEIRKIFIRFHEIYIIENKNRYVIEVLNSRFPSRIWIRFCYVFMHFNSLHLLGEYKMCFSLWLLFSILIFLLTYSASTNFNVWKHLLITNYVKNISIPNEHFELFISSQFLLKAKQSLNVNKISFVIAFKP